MRIFKNLRNRFGKRLLAFSTGQLCPRNALDLGLVSFSQAGEDLVVFNLLIEMQRRPPFHYVDVGCFEPVRYSNTYFFYLLGGSGLVIDLHEQHASAFGESRPRDKFVAAVVSDRPEMLSVISQGSPFDRVGVVEGDATALSAPRSLASILETDWPEQLAIDLLDVDCEGSDISVLRSNDWSRFRPSVVVVEDFPEHAGGTDASGIMAFLKSVGYELKLQLRNNLFFVDKSVPSEQVR